MDGIGAVIFKSLYKNKRENVWVPGWVACPGVFGTKTTPKSTFFKMGVSLEERYYTDFISRSNRWRGTGQQRVLYNYSNPGPRHSLITSH